MLPILRADMKQVREQTVLLHDSQELDDDLAGGTDEHLALSTTLSIADGIEGVVQHGDKNHFISRLKARIEGMG